MRNDSASKTKAPVKTAVTSVRTIFIYAALFAGSVIFAWPFIWMAATSAKLERELFSEKTRIFPQAPRPQIRSPYMDDRRFRDVGGPRMDEAIAITETRLRSANETLDPEIDRTTALT